MVGSSRAAPRRGHRRIQVLERRLSPVSCIDAAGRGRAALAVACSDGLAAPVGSAEEARAAAVAGVAGVIVDARVAPALAGVAADLTACLVLVRPDQPGACTPHDGARGDSDPPALDGVDVLRLVPSPPPEMPADEPFAVELPDGLDGGALLGATVRAVQAGAGAIVTSDPRSVGRAVFVWVTLERHRPSGPQAERR
ncbi:MAG: hypothetical protein HYX34_03150 [Actinobacteria bacterium]|nr:hypothetical protein [Actinomycetota bacterium]